MTRSTGPIPDVPGMDYAHPLYVIPTEYWDSLPDDIRCSIVAMYGDGLVRVYAAPAHLATTVMQSDIDPDDYATMKAITTIVTTLVNSGVIDADTILKENQ